MNKQILLIILIASLTFSFTPREETATVFIARKGIWSATIGAVPIFIDGKFACDLSNNKFAAFKLSPGKYTFSIQWGGQNQNNTAEKNAVSLEVQEGKEYYLNTIKKNKVTITYLVFQEVTANSWNTIMEGIEIDSCK